MHLAAYSGQVASESPAEEVCRTEYAAKLSTCARIKRNAPSLASDKRRAKRPLLPQRASYSSLYWARQFFTVALNLDIN